jgi:ABC-2 type transport system permease protein
MTGKFLGYRYLTATRFTLLEQARNRLAFGLLIIFVPIWYYLAVLIATNEPIDFKFRPTQTFLHVSTVDISLLTLGLNAITLIVGFILFTSIRKNTPFDRRLVLSGYPQPLLILAKLTTLLVIAALVSLYAGGILFIYWHPANWPLVWLGFFCAALTYGGLGLLLGVLVTSELAGFFFIIMLSLIDTFIQNPVGNPVANQNIVLFFPAFAPTQLSVAGGFTSIVPGNYILFSLAWLVAFSLLGLAIFYLKTHVRNVHRVPLIAELSAAANDQNTTRDREQAP